MAFYFNYSQSEEIWRSNIEDYLLEWENHSSYFLAISDDLENNFCPIPMIEENNNKVSSSSYENSNTHNKVDL
jgi:hypothetical protein